MLLGWMMPSLLALASAPAAPPVEAATERPAVRPAQDDETAAVAAAMKTLRDRRSDEGAREAAMDALLGLGVAGPRALATYLEVELGRLRRSNARAESRVLKRFPRAAEKVLKVRLDRDAERARDEARAVVLRNAADPALTKERIHAESDPAYAQLVELLTVTPNQVWEHDESLFEDWADLLDSVDREVRMLGRWSEARDALAAAPGGAAQASRLRAPERPSRDADALVAEVARLAVLARPMSRQDHDVLEHNAALADALDPEEAAGIRALNLRRILLGLPAQRTDPKLCDACRGHSRDMVEHGFFAHESPLEGRETPWKRAAQEGTSASAENIAAGAATGPDAILQWWYSPGHHRNMLGGGARTGLGRHERHWTQLFG